MYKKFLSCFISGVILMFIILPLFVSAQKTVTDPSAAKTVDNPPSGTIVIANPFQQNTIIGLINTILDDILIPIGGVVAVIMIMYAGFMYVTARGNTTQISKATEALKYAAIGAAILLGAKVISAAITATITQLKV